MPSRPDVVGREGPRTRGWKRLEVEEHSHAAMANAYTAGASGLPCAIFKGYLGSDLVRHNPNSTPSECPFTGETLSVIRPSVRM